MSDALAKINQAIAILTQVQGEITVCASYGDAAKTAAKASLVNETLEKCRASCELRLHAAEVYIRAEANLGRWLKLRPKGRPRNGSSDDPFRVYKVRADRARRLASFNGQLEHALARVRAAILSRAREKGRPLAEGDLRRMSVKGVLDEIESRPVTPRGVLRPSDLWVFNPPRYGRIDDADGHGYLPGDVYCNILWQWARPGNIVADVMAGSGMLRHVYDRRAEWLPEGESLDLDVRLFDLNPRGPHGVIRHDARHPLPCRPDLIVMDVPYFGIVRGAYGNSPDDIANAPDEWQWLEMLGKVAAASFASQCDGDRCCVVIASAYLDMATGRRFQAGPLVLARFGAAGYALADCAYFGRAIQAMGGSKMRFVNADAVRRRRLLSEMTHVLLFVKES